MAADTGGLENRCNILVERHAGVGGCRRQFAPVHRRGGELHDGKTGSGQNKCGFHVELVWLIPGKNCGKTPAKASLFRGVLAFQLIL
jgi:hypothetical protein